MIRPRVAAALAAVGIAATLALGTSPALADSSAKIEFADLTPITTPFASDWYARAVVRMPIGGGATLPAPPAQGTVDVYVQGISEPWSKGLPITADGSVYISQPLAQPLLPAGTHNLTAVFVPAPGGYLSTSQTSTPIQVTITPFTLAGAVELVTTSPEPMIQGTLSGTWMDKMKGSPAGTWSFTVTDSDGEAVFSVEAPVAQGATEPVGVALSTKLVPDATYTVTGVFTPVAELAGGVTLSDVKSLEYTAPSAGGAGVLAVPLWALIAAGVVVLGLAAANIVLAVRRRKAAPLEAVPARDDVPALTE